MFDLSRHLHFIRSLELFSTKLEALLDSARLQPSQLTPELIDDIAYITGELMLVLTNHSGSQKDALVQEVLSHARDLREHLRDHQLQTDQVTKDCHSFSQEIARLVSDSKKAA